MPGFPRHGACTSSLEIGEPITIFCFKKVGAPVAWCCLIAACIRIVWVNSGVRLLRYRLLFHKHQGRDRPSARAEGALQRVPLLVEPCKHLLIARRARALPVVLFPKTVKGQRFEFLAAGGHDDLYLIPNVVRLHDDDLGRGGLGRDGRKRSKGTEPEEQGDDFSMTPKYFALDVFRMNPLSPVKPVFTALPFA